MNSPATPAVHLEVASDHEGMRLDRFLAEHFADHSRMHLKRSIEAGGVTVDGKQAKASLKLQPGQQVACSILPSQAEGPQPEDIPLEVLYEDDLLVVINKPPGMVVHPSKGHGSGTLAAALQFHFDELSSVGGQTRPGIVHRLDRDTSGVIAVAKTDQAHLRLAEQFAERTLSKEYFALVAGRLEYDRDLIDLPIGMHPKQREKMAIREDHSTSRPAQTFFEVAERFDGFLAVKAFPKTGRTHQIRVHLAARGCPVLCDRLYGSRARITLGELRRLPPDHPEHQQVLLERQALHARRLTLRHPASGQELTFEAPLPEDIETVLTALRQYRPL